VMIDLQQARSEAVLRTGAVQFRFSRHPKGSCYIIHAGASGDCRCSDAGQAVCNADGLPIKLEWFPGQTRISVSANISNLSFQARQGAVTSTGSIDITGDDGQAIRHVVSIAGRVRSCSPDGSFKNLTKCTS